MVELGRMVQAQRVRRGFTTADELAAVAGLAVRTVEIIEAGSHSGRPRATTFGKLEDALRWAGGSCDDFLDYGTRPRERDEPDPLKARVDFAWARMTSGERIELVHLAEDFIRRS